MDSCSCHFSVSLLLLLLVLFENLCTVHNALFWSFELHSSGLPDVFLRIFLHLFKFFVMNSKEKVGKSTTKFCILSSRFCITIEEIHKRILDKSENLTRPYMVGYSVWVYFCVIEQLSLIAPLCSNINTNAVHWYAHTVQLRPDSREQFNSVWRDMMPIFNQRRQPKRIVRFACNGDLEGEKMVPSDRLYQFERHDTCLTWKKAQQQRQTIKRKKNKKNTAIFMRHTESDEPNVNRNHFDRKLMRCEWAQRKRITEKKNRNDFRMSITCYPSTLILFIS